MDLVIEKFEKEGFVNLKREFLKNSYKEFEGKSDSIYRLLKVPKSILRQFPLIGYKDTLRLSLSLVEYNEDLVRRYLTKEIEPYAYNFYNQNDSDYVLNNLIFHLRLIEELAEMLDVNKNSVLFYILDNYITVTTESFYFYTKNRISLSLEDFPKTPSKKNFPKYLFKTERFFLDNYEKELNKEILKTSEELSFYEYTYKDYSLSLPKSIDEFRKESLEMANSIYNYKEDFANTKKIIGFVKKKGKTISHIEISNMKVINAVAFANTKIDEATNKFLERYEAKLNSLGKKDKKD